MKTDGTFAVVIMVHSDPPGLSAACCYAPFDSVEQAEKWIEKYASKDQKERCHITRISDPYSPDEVSNEN